jgi:hypothetical protein
MWVTVDQLLPQGISHIPEVESARLGLYLGVEEDL